MTELLEKPSQVFPSRFESVQYRRAEIADVDERSVLLRAVPYDVEAQLDRDLFESFEPAAFANATRDPGRVKLWFGHSDTPSGMIVGKADQIQDLPDGVQVRSRVSQLPEGDRLLTLLRDEVLDEASIEFNPMPKSMTVTRAADGMFHVRHKRAHLLGVALVPQGAYGRNALVLSVRDIRAKERDRVRAEALARLQAYNH